MTTFTGLYVERLSTGIICDVQVVDESGNENSLSPDVYLQSNLMPPIEQLPDFDEYNKKNIDIINCKPKVVTYKSIIGWATILSIFVALIAATLSAFYYCAAYDSETCSWQRGYFPFTSALFFVILWPIFLLVGWIKSQWGASNA